MSDRLLKCGTCLFLILLTAVPAQAQESAWGLRVFPNAGVYWPLRNLGKNAVEIQQQSALQTVAQMETSPTIGGGAEFVFPDGDTRIRGQIMTTLGATARGVLGLCESGQLAAPDQGLCALDITTDAQVIDGTAELVFLTGDPGGWVRPAISFGVGIRSFDFDSAALDCDSFGSQLTDEYQVCNKSRQILEAPSVNPSITFGLGLEVDREPLTAFVRLSALSASYTGGSGLADGARQMDLSLTGGLAFKVR